MATNTYKKMLSKRNKIIKKFSTKEPNFFKIQDYIDLEKYSSYVMITPRSIGKSYSGWELVIGVYEESGEYTVWMRTSDTELKFIIEDYKRNRPEAWPEYAEVKGRSLIDTRSGGLICKFVALSTVGNLASIKGDGCFGIYYDEFLPRDKKPMPRAFNKITDFIKTVERKHLLTVILTANLTTLNSDILNKLDLWIDEPTVDDEVRRLRYRYIQEWENPPIVDEISTASIWASHDANLKAFMDKAEVLDQSSSEVIPESRLGQLRHLEKYQIDGVVMTLSIQNDGSFALLKGEKMKGHVYDLTTEDGYQPSKNHIRPYSVNTQMSKIMYALENNAMTFTDFEVRDVVIRLLISLNGKITNRR